MNTTIALCWGCQQIRVNERVEGRRCELFLFLGDEKNMKEKHAEINVYMDVRL